LDLRSICCGPKFMHVRVMHASMRSSVHIVSRQAGRLLDIGHTTCRTIALASAECFATGSLESGDTENGMSCALGFLATCPEIQPRSMG
jgi:hypothetical protein